jgi:hypothetical protein
VPIITKDNVKYLQFGYGDIFVGDARDKKTEKVFGVVFALTEPKEIGTEWKEVKDKPLDDFDVHVVMQFDDIRSLDVVIEVLENIRKEMIL